MALTKVSTDGVKDDAITSGKIPANAVGASELADNAVDTNAIANNAVTAGKTSGVATTINNNADNRVITGSGTANTLNGESQLTYNGTLKNSVAAENGTIAQFELSGQANNPALLIKADESDQQITFRAGASTSTYPSVAFNMGTVGDAVIINSSGKVNIGDTQMSSNLLNIEDGTAAAIDFASHGTGGDTAYIGVKKSTGGGLTFGISNRDFIFKTGATYSNGTTFDSGLERMRIDSSGKVGIGNSSPSFTLDTRRASEDALRLGNTSETGHASHNVKVAAGNTYYQNLKFNTSDVKFETYNGSSLGERVRIRKTGGITFNGDSADANALDDYEEGTWTPVIQGTGSNNSKNYVTQTAHYTKVGRLVTVSYRIAWNNKSADSGTAIISGLPFVINESTASGGAFVGNNLDFPANTVVATTETAESQQYVYILVGFDSGTWDNPSTSFFQSSGNIRGQFHYITNA